MVWDLYVIQVDDIINIYDLIFHVNLYMLGRTLSHWHEYIKMLHKHLNIQKKEKK